MHTNMYDNSYRLENQASFEDKQKYRVLFEKGLSDEIFESIPEPEIWCGWVVKNGINIVYSAGGVGKSHMSIALADYISRLHSVYSLYIDADVSLPAIKMRVWKEDRDGIAQTNSFFKYIHKDLNLSYYKLTFQEFFQKKSDIEGLLEVFSFIYGSGLVVIDSLQKFVDINDIKQLEEFFSILRRYNNTYIIIHHTNKINLFKGLTYIRDMADSMYLVKNVERNGGHIISHTLEADKRRYLTEDTVYIKYEGIRVREIVDVAVESDEEKIVLRVAVSALKKEGRMKQSDLVSEIQKKLPNVGQKKVTKILQDYSEKGLFITTKGSYNATYYEVNYASEYMSVVFDGYSISEKKKEALQLVSGLPDAFNIEIKSSEGLAVYTTRDALAKAIYRYDDDFAEAVLEAVQNQNQNNSDDDSVEF